MENIFNLNGYKEQLAQVYSWGCDADKYTERFDCIQRKYTDEYLNNIINQTLLFIEFLMNKMILERKIFDGHIYDGIELIEKDSVRLQNGCHGGFSCDSLFSINEEEPLISIHLVENYFGEEFRIWLSWKDYEDTNKEEESGLEYGFETFQISGPIKAFDNLCNKYNLTRILD